jgi:tripartite-type tricarboxylate transporter receptor subunit TctC
VHILVGFAPGGPTDIAARLIGQWLSDRLGQPFIIENRPGAATNIATEAVVRSPPDGYTLLAAVSSNTMNPALYTNLGFNFIRDIAMVAGLQRSPLVLGVHPSLPVTSVPELGCVRQGKSAQDEPGLLWVRHDLSGSRRTVPDDGRH